MRIDFATLAFGYSVKVGGGTPNWATSLGQGKDYKINESADIDELLKGMVYSSVSLSKVTSKIGKGGRVMSGNADESPIIVASLFKRVYVNDTLISNGCYVILITRDTSASHAGRLRFKYGPSNTYLEDDKVYSNELFWKQAKAQLGLEEDACFFVYDISVENQNELRLNTIIIDANKKVEYVDSTDLHAAWDELIEESEKKRGVKTYTPLKDDEIKEINEVLGTDEVTPEWFNEKAKEFPTLDDEGNKFLMKFKMVFAPDKLQELSGLELLETIFLNGKNKTNLCYILEFDKDCRMLFGSIKSGTAYKYGLHYSQKNKSWATGTSRNPKLLSENEAIELGTQIRDNLIAGYDILADAGEINNLEDYQMLYNDLDDITDGYVNRVWFMKYYALLFPTIFPPIYSDSAQSKVLNKLSLGVANNPISRLGLIKKYVDKCDISNIVFSRVFWSYCNGDNEKDGEEEDSNNMIDATQEGVSLKNCLEIERSARANKVNPINFIVYGAPGTGKTYSMIEYALAIVDNITIEKYRESNQDRKASVDRYKELVKEGQIVFTTFHQNYGYEEFIQGLRPDTESETMAFKTVDGVFKRIADKALNDAEDRNYVIIIDEINRANISKVFGELITLIEEDKRWGELNETCATLQSGDVFAVPNNLYIVGTMNSADKSISLIDAALRRRFDFIEQKPDASLLNSQPVIKALFENINKKLVKDLQSTDLLVGHSYFLNKTTDDLSSILNNNIIPLLYEYYYDDRNKVRNLLDTVIKDSNANLVIDDEEMGRLRVKDGQ